MKTLRAILIITGLGLFAISAGCSFSPPGQSNSSGSGGNNKPAVTNFVLFSVTTNSLGTNGLIITTNSVSNIPATYFSNFIISNSASYPYRVTVISNAETNNVPVYTVTNYFNFTNYSPGTTNLLNSVMVAFQLYSVSTNITTNLSGVSYYSLDVSNFTVSNYLVSNIYTVITNALTNSFSIYMITNASTNSSDFSTTNYYPVTGEIILNFTISSPDYQSVTFASNNVTVELGQTLVLSTSNPVLTGLTGWRWYVNNIPDTSQASSTYSFVSTGLQPGQYIINVDVVYAGVDYSGSLMITVAY